MIYLYKTNGVITVGEDGKVPVTYYGRGGKSGKFYPKGSKGTITGFEIIENTLYLNGAANVTFFPQNSPTTSTYGTGDWFFVSVSNHILSLVSLTIQSWCSGGTGFIIGDEITLDLPSFPGYWETTGKVILKVTSVSLDGGFLINIGGDNYDVAWENLVINGTSPTSFSDANTLLLNLFS